MKVYVLTKDIRYEDFYVLDVYLDEGLCQDEVNNLTHLQGDDDEVSFDYEEHDVIGGNNNPDSVACGNNPLQSITKNGEITFDPDTKEYTVWDETYSDTVCVTNYPSVANAALEAYSKYLDKERL